MKTILTSIFIFLSFSSHSQSIRILKQNLDHTAKDIWNTFQFLHEDFELDSNRTIATLQGYSSESGNTSFYELFDSLWEISHQLGANSFSIDSIARYGDTTSIILSIFYLQEAELDSNLQLYPKNMIYIFGDLSNKNKFRPITLNRQPLTITPKQYLIYQNIVGQKVSISTSGPMSSTIRIKGKTNRQSNYLSIVGGQIGPGNMSSQGIGISFSGTGIMKLNPYYGQFLIHVLHNKKIIKPTAD